MSNKSKTSIKVNYIYSILYQVLASILPLVTSPYIARTIGAEGLGIYSYSYSIAHYFAIFILLGLSNYGNRSIAAVRDDKEKMSATFCEIYCMQLALAVIFITGYIIYLIAFSRSDFIINALMTIYLFSVALDINWFFYGVELFKLTVIRNTVVKVATVAAIFMFVHTSDDVWIYTLIMVGGFLGSTLALWPYLKHYIYWIWPKPRNVIKHLKPNFILFIPVIAINIYKYMDKIMLGALINKTQVGYYENAEKVILIPMGFITAFGNVMLPKMSNLYATGKKENVQRYMQISFHFITILTLAMAFGLASVATKFSVIFWGESFEVCGVLIAILSISMIFISWPNIIRTQYLIPTHNEKYYIISVCVGAVVNFVANYLLIFKFEAVGTAIGTVLAELSVCVIQILAVWKPLGMKRIIKKNIMFIIPGVIMYLLVLYIDRNTRIGIIPLLIEIIVGAIVFSILLAVMELFFNRDEFISFLKAMLSNRFKESKIQDEID